MTGGASAIPYRHLSVGKTRVICREDHVADARELLREGSLYKGAARRTGAFELKGRGISYAIELPKSGVHAVVRHNRHGGLFAPLTRDLFLPPTRAPYELFAARQLHAAGVRTPEVLMIGIEPAAMLFRRSDVATREIFGFDLSYYMHPQQTAEDRRAAWAATRELVRELNAAGARHHDLNVKNILLAPSAEGFEAWVLDVDRVEFGEPGSKQVREGNVARLLRSARKWRDERGSLFDELELGSVD